MTDFNAKMHQNRFRLGLRPRPRWGSLQRSPDPLAGFGGRFAAGEGLGWGRGGKGEGGGSGGEGKGGPQVTVEPGPSQGLATPLNFPSLKICYCAIFGGSTSNCDPQISDPLRSPDTFVLASWHQTVPNGCV